MPTTRIRRALTLPAVLLQMLLLAACDPAPSPGESAPPAAAAESAMARAAQSAVEIAASDDAEAPWWTDLPRAGWAPFERIEIPQDQGWYEVHRVAPGTWALLEPGQWQEVTSWLIEGEDKALLFDTGLGIGNVERVARALTDREIVVLNSHTHFDHVGGNHLFREILGTRFPFAKARTAGRSHEQGLEDMFQEGAVWMDLPEDFDRESFRTRPWTVTGYVTNGQVIELGGRALEVMFTPGHSPDSLSLLDAANRILFVGDTFYPAPLYSHLEGSSFADYRHSAALLAEHAEDVDLVATGHNEPVQDGAILTRMHEAFEAVANGKPPDEVSDTAQVFDFGTFKIITAAGQVVETGQESP